jgi:hypothetical protein
MSEKKLILNANERLHSLWGSSGSSRWSRCPMSVAMTLADPANVPVKKASDAMMKGTAVHRLCEWILANAPCCVPSSVEVNVRGNGETHVFTLDEKDIENAVDYAHYVLSFKKDAPHAKMLVETELFLAPTVFGVADAVVFENYLGVVHIFDYKNGEYPVDFDPEGLDQAGFLASAASKHLLPEKVRQVHFHYIQPNRRDGQTAVSSKTFTFKDLRKLKKLFMSAVETSKAPGVRDDMKNYCTGSHCSNCPHHVTCPAYPEMAAQAAAVQFSAPEPAKVAALVQQKGMVFNKSVKEILAMKTSLLSWFEAFEEAVTAEALTTGQAPDGMKLVRGRAGKRVWRLSDEEIVAALVEKKGVAKEAIFTTELRSPAQVEKAVKGLDLSDLIVQKDGKPVLAPKEDPRPGLCHNEFDVVGNTTTPTTDLTVL